MALQSHSSGLRCRMASDRALVYNDGQITPILVLQNESISDSVVDKGIIHYQEFDRSVHQLVKRIHGAQPDDLARRHKHYKFPCQSTHCVQMSDGVFRVHLDLVARVQQMRYASLVLEYEPDDFISDPVRVSIPAPQNRVSDIFRHILKFLDGLELSSASNT